LLTAQFRLDLTRPAKSGTLDHNSLDRSAAGAAHRGGAAKRGAKRRAAALGLRDRDLRI
jgi:hypothetical protein